MISELFIFFIALAVLAVLGKYIIQSLVDLSRLLGMKEFVVAFFTISVGAVAPELLVGISSALRGVPEMALGNVVGENIFLLTVTVALCTFFTSQGIQVESKTVRMGITFTVAAALLPLLLIFDGELSRWDGIILIGFFVLFIYWLFSKRERFLKIYAPVKQDEKTLVRPGLIKNLIIATAGLAAVIICSQIIVSSAQAFAEAWPLSLTFIGIFFLGLGTALPETYFALTLTWRGESWMVLGGIMGGVAIASTLVLGLVAIIHPIIIEDVTSLVLGRLFLAIAAIVFLFTISTSNRITKKEGLILLAIYIIFLLLEITLPGTGLLVENTGL